MKHLSNCIAGLTAAVIFCLVAAIYIGVPLLAIYAACHFIAKYW